MAEQPALRLEPEHLGGSAGSNYQGPRLNSLLALDRESNRRIFESHIGHIAAHEFRAEALGLRPHLFHQIGAHDGMAESRIVLHLGGGTQLASRSGDRRRGPATGWRAPHRWRPSIPPAPSP